MNVLSDNNKCENCENEADIWYAYGYRCWFCYDSYLMDNHLISYQQIHTDKAKEKYINSPEAIRYFKHKIN